MFSLPQQPIEVHRALVAIGPEQAERTSQSSSGTAPTTTCWTQEMHELYLRRLGLDAAAVIIKSPSSSSSPPSSSSPSSSTSPSSASSSSPSSPRTTSTSRQKNDFVADHYQPEQLLAAITEAHVRCIPFENLSQHGATVGGPQSLDIAAIVNKVLRRHRGGFCFELNALLAEWLLYLGHYQVKRIPAYVYAGDEVGGFRTVPTHLLLLVSLVRDDDDGNNNNNNDDDVWVVDVAFGEPAIHPLRYVMGLTQTTPEGMESRLQEVDDNGDIILEWNKPEAGGWIPRLKWNKADTVHGLPLAEFAPYLASVLDEDSVFAKKMLICRIDRTAKRTLSGTKYKITSPRFGAQSQVSVRQLASDEEVRRVLWTDFGIAMEETVDLSTAKSDRADPTLFSHM